MCGLFAVSGAYFAETLRDVALLASTRGPHSHGVAWFDGESLRVSRASGPLTSASVSKLPRAAAWAVAGHSRLATTGVNVADVSSAQPLDCGDIVVCHNGRVPRFAALAAAEGLAPSTDNDSEVLGRLIAKRIPLDGIARAIVNAVRSACPSTPGALVVLHRSALAFYAFGQPLFARVTPTWSAVCSREFAGAVAVRPKTGAVIYRDGSSEEISS